MRHFELLGYVLVVGGALVPFFAEHLFGTAALSACTFVLLAGGGAVLLVLNRRSREQENGAGVATLFGGVQALEASASQPSFELQYAAPAAALPETSPLAQASHEAEFADLSIEYSHNDRDPVVRRNKSLVVKNSTEGKDAYNVRIRPMESPHDKLRFNPERIVRLAGGETAEVAPEPGSLDGGYVRQTHNHLPDFVAGLYNTSGRTDIQALNEIYEERSLMIEIEYESGGKRIVSRCELLYTPWHRNIRMGNHSVRQATAAEQ